MLTEALALEIGRGLGAKGKERTREEGGVDQVPSYLPQLQLSAKVQLVFPTEASLTPAVPARPPRGSAWVACTSRQATPIPHHRVLLAGPPGGHEGPSKHRPHAPQSQLVPHGSQSGM